MWLLWSHARVINGTVVQMNDTGGKKCGDSTGSVESTCSLNWGLVLYTAVD